MNRIVATITAVGALMASHPAEASPEKLPTGLGVERQLDKIPKYLDEAHRQRLKVTIQGEADDLASAGLSKSEAQETLSDFTEGLREAAAIGFINEETENLPSPTGKDFVLAAGVVALVGVVTFGGASLVGHRRR